MNAKQPRNLAASVRQRLLNHARKKGEDFQYVLTRYGLERLLYRLSRSPHADSFVLKGAVLFQLWSDQPHRPTRDLDLLGQGEPSTDRLEQLFCDICAVSVEDDGLRFLGNSVRAEPIKEHDEYQGIRLRIDARLESARIPLQVDVGFGDVITPGTIDVLYPTLFDFPAPSIRAYPRETVVAEKFQAMVMLGIANTRMKDFYDLWTLALRFEFDGPTICQAIEATFRRRQTELPSSTPIALTGEFAQDRDKANQWRAFLERGGLVDQTPTLDEAVVVLDSFLMPPTRALIEGRSFPMRWPSEGPWQRV